MPIWYTWSGPPRGNRPDLPQWAINTQLEVKCEREDECRARGFMPVPIWTNWWLRLCPTRASGSAFISTHTTALLLWKKVSSEVRVRATWNEGDQRWGLYTMPPWLPGNGHFYSKHPEPIWLYGQRSTLTLHLLLFFFVFFCCFFCSWYSAGTVCRECRESGLAGHGHELRHRCCALYHWFQHI